jgi:hypothetical protein
MGAAYVWFHIFPAIDTRSQAYDKNMASSEPPFKSKALDEAALWIVIGLLLALGVAWEAYPRIYIHYYYSPHGTGSSSSWANESFGPSPIVRYFFYACLIGFAGFAQLHFSQWFQRDVPKGLLRAFLFACFVMLAGMWTFALANRFWTVQFHPGALQQVERTMHMGGTVAVLGLWSSLAAALLNLAYGLVRKRRA